ncbi:hypothetical protein BGW80DRAFT_1434859 [Lactifluus volemus]|nr:hypothetical protein BGW80DRAFT_1434859 [Lactifluus volemus]
MAIPSRKLFNVLKIVVSSHTSPYSTANPPGRLPLSLGAAQTVLEGRKATEAIFRGTDDRLIVVVGPCSVHDLKAYADSAKDDLHIIMRLINDPDMNSTFQINRGLRIARSLLLDFLDTISPQYTADLVSWGAIGARTTESQVHRELTSALSMPTGFKNSTDGGVGVAIDACRAARSGHVFLSVGKEGLSSIVETEGNPDVHVILRGGSKGPNYAAEYIDCSHGNSSKQHQRQIDVAEDIARQLESGDTGSLIMGVMIESNLVEGRQDIPASGKSMLKYGQSVTDACISWESTVPVLDRLREGVRGRRNAIWRAARGLDATGVDA